MLNWSNLAATRYLLGISLEELSKILGYSFESIKHAIPDTGKTGNKSRDVNALIHDFFDECINSFDEDARNKFYMLREALMETSYKGFTNRFRHTSVGNRVYAMGYTQTTLCAEMKKSQSKMSKTMNNKDANDDLMADMRAWLDAKYSVMSAADQNRVDLRESALDIAGCPERNPFRKQLIANGMMTKDRIKYRYRTAVITSEAIGDSEQEIKDLKEYIKMLEEENDVLRNQRQEIAQIADKLKAENMELQDRLEKRKEEINNASTTATLKSLDIPGLNFTDCSVTINIVRENFQSPNGR